MTQNLLLGRSPLFNFGTTAKSLSLNLPFDQNLCNLLLNDLIKYFKFREIRLKPFIGKTTTSATEILSFQPFSWRVTNRKFDILACQINNLFAPLRYVPTKRLFQARLLFTSYEGFEASKVDKQPTSSSQKFKFQRFKSFLLLSLGLALLTWGTGYGIFLIFDKPEPVQISIDHIKGHRVIQEEMGGASLSIGRFWQGYVHKDVAYIKLKVYGPNGEIGIAMSDLYKIKDTWNMETFRFFKFDHKQGTPITPSIVSESNISQKKSTKEINKDTSVTDDILAAQLGHSIGLTSKEDKPKST